MVPRDVRSSCPADLGCGACVWQLRAVLEPCSQSGAAALLLLFLSSASAAEIGHNSVLQSWECSRAWTTHSMVCLGFALLLQGIFINSKIVLLSRDCRGCLSLLPSPTPSSSSDFHSTEQR